MTREQTRQVQALQAQHQAQLEEAHKQWQHWEAKKNIAINKLCEWDEIIEGLLAVNPNPEAKAS